MRIFLWLSFDGTAYHGWQIQPNGMSVQEKVQQCLSTLLSQPIAVTGAGRTDAGVHARTMVCHFDIDKELNTDQLCYRLNRILPRDISCGRAEHVSDEMHARFSAKRRTYRYFIHTQRDPFLRHYSVETHWKLDFEMMNEAALWLTTQNDFKAFCKAGADNKTTLCQVTTAQWVSTSPTTWYFEIAANRFLRNMVRAVVGTLFEVGRHRMTLEQFREVVATGTRSDAGESMPAHGLFLWDIEY
ncbi:tRNA pseudouridine(38-40) synthase TruA [Hallella mizrahii]|uniref:tRNA pseudouridine synthase A n=1 Tax=Hallella mizrahii TaxID=2606637 RepID=A0A7K0KCY1_9BACT|nr:tRNA pseudouridine(38-40) synthase TruA [Hallella mizrahii]MST83754.1 tRNA pseudouridine(38-40) synthase TruA [Hallella mizrahii]